MHYDVIVIGIGAMGSAAAESLARRQVGVLGIEQFDIPNDRGSSGGDTRLIRKAYFEHPDYVPLLEAAYARWRNLEERSGRQILFPTGTVYIGRPDGDLVGGTVAAAEAHQLPYEHLDQQQLNDRVGPFRLPEDAVCVYEPDGGLLLAGRAIDAFAGLAQAQGADLHTGERVLGWSESSAGVEVRTDRSRYSADQLLICGGAWSADLLKSPDIPLKVTRQTLFWIQPYDPKPFKLGRFSCWAAESSIGMCYGFPILDAATETRPGLKVANHAHGETTVAGKLRPAASSDFEALKQTLARLLPDADGPLSDSQACMYTSSPDEHFIIDRLPHHQRVTIACGFSGHGFKFASVMGEVLADLALDRHTTHQIGFLGLDRFS